jgi:hypothetical protein
MGGGGGRGERNSGSGVEGGLAVLIVDTSGECVWQDAALRPADSTYQQAWKK